MSVVGRARMRQLRHRHGRTMTKYFVGSLVAGLVSTVTFAVTFGVGLLGSKGASLTASATGAIANYFLNRYWAWGRRGRADVRRELIPYWRTVIVTAVLAAAVTGGVNALLRHMNADRPVRTVVNTIAFVGTYGVLFLVKYRVFDRLFRVRHHRSPATAGYQPVVDSEAQPVAGISSAAASSD